MNLAAARSLARQGLCFSDSQVCLLRMCVKWGLLPCRELRLGQRKRWVIKSIVVPTTRAVLISKASPAAWPGRTREPETHNDFGCVFPSSVSMPWWLPRAAARGSLPP